MGCYGFILAAYFFKYLKFYNNNIIKSDNMKYEI